MADVIKGEMIRGQIDTVILLALVEGDKDSNDIRTAIEEKSDNQYSIKQGTFYSAMQRLVKQGYIKEYRSSAMDGIRRKYYSITPKGTKFLDKNREQWTASKTLVDSLFDTEEKTPEEKPAQQPKQAQTYVDEFDSFKAFVDDNGEDFKIETEDFGEDYFSNIGADVLNDLNTELKKQAQPLPQQDDVKNDEIEDNSSDYEENYETVSNESKEDLLTFDVFDKDGLIKEAEQDLDCFSDDLLQTETSSEYEEFYQDLEEDLDVASRENSPPANEISTPTYENSTTADEGKKTAEEKTLETGLSQDDDLLIVEEYSPTNKNKYKQILNKILPKEPVKSEDDDYPYAEQTATEEKSPVSTEEKFSEQPIYNSQQSSTASDSSEKQQAKASSYSQQYPSDFSDLYAMANREGFKIRTSYNTNKFVGSQILINKLVMHSSLVFFIILALECLILNFALGAILNWKFSVKLIILGCLAVFPLVTLLIYLINSKRSVYEIASFKDAMSVALIVTFQLAILILCIALFVSVDFNNFKEVITFILLPFILSINIPIYFILKYSLLSTGKYFTK